MSDHTNYSLKMTGEDFDPEFIIFKLFKSVRDANNYINETGDRTGNGYDWRTLQDDMGLFSIREPGILFEIVESGAYDGETFEFRHYFKEGKYARIEPVVTIKWPEFTERMLS